MFPHHEISIKQVTEFYQNDPDIQALILGGSLAHGYAESSSDIDVMCIVEDAVHEQRQEEGRLHFLNTQLCTYEGGYVDGKCLSVSFLKKVAEYGSEPARFAFQDSRVLFSRSSEIEAIISSITRYPAEDKDKRIQRFYAQFEAWYWYVKEAIKKNNPYLLNLSISKMVLFGARLILAHNEMLYPYHKWMLRVLADAPDKPSGLIRCIDDLYANPSSENALHFCETIKNFHPWGSSLTWPAQFVIDSEWNWLHGMTPVDDL